VTELAALAIRAEDGLLLAHLSGEIDLSNSQDLELAIAEAVPNTATGMVLDLSDLTYIDSAGIRLLLTLARRFRWRGQELTLVVPDGSGVRRVLELAGAGSALALDPTTEAARARMGGPDPAATGRSAR
jgi:anti-anti-sigma factor